MCLNSEFRTSSDNNPLQIGPKLMKIWPRGVMGHFWVADRGKDGSRMSSRRKQENHKSFFNRSCGPKGAVLKIMKSENGAQIKLFIIVQHLKTVPRAGLETT